MRLLVMGLVRHSDHQSVPNVPARAGALPALHESTLLWREPSSPPSERRGHSQSRSMGVRGLTRTATSNPARAA